MFDKPKEIIVPIRNNLKSQYRENKGSKIQEIGVMNNSIHWFMNKIFVKKNINSTDAFITLVNHKVPFKIRKRVGIIYKFGKQD